MELATSGGSADGLEWIMGLHSRWSLMNAAHESTHDEISLETPFGQTRALLALLIKEGRLEVGRYRRARQLYFQCADVSKNVNETAATYLGWLSVVGNGHLEALASLAPDYQAYVRDAYAIAGRFARSKFLHYTIIQASTYLAFHHRSLWRLADTESLDGLILPVESYPDTQWSSIRSSLLQSDPDLIRSLLEPACRRTGIRFEDVDTDFEYSGPEQKHWIESNEVFVTELRIALGQHLQLDMILDPVERKEFQSRLCLLAERLFDVTADHVYLPGSTHHSLFPDEMQADCPLDTVFDAPVEDALESVSRLQEEPIGTTIVSLFQAGSAVTLVVTNDQLGSKILRWNNSSDIGLLRSHIENQIRVGDLTVAHRIEIVPRMSNEKAIRQWLASRPLEVPADHTDGTALFEAFYTVGSFEHWVTAIADSISKAILFPIQLRNKGKDQARVLLWEISTNRFGKPFLKFLPEPATEHLMQHLAEARIPVEFAPASLYDFKMINHLQWVIEKL